MLKTLLNEVLTLFKSCNLLLLSEDRITQEGNYLLFSSMRSKEESYREYELKIYVAGNSLNKDGSSIFLRIEEILELCFKHRANALSCVNASLMSWEKVGLFTQTNGLFVYEITLNLKTRRKQ